jgi:hypothetical protein
LLWWSQNPSVGFARGLDHSTADLVQWTLMDHLNTVRDIAQFDPQTRATTVVSQFFCDSSAHPLYGPRGRVVYDAFGRVTSESDPAVESLFLFTARPLVGERERRGNLPARAFDAQTKKVENLPQKNLRPAINSKKPQPLVRCFCGPLAERGPGGVWRWRWKFVSLCGESAKFLNRLCRPPSPTTPNYWCLSHLDIRWSFRAAS